ncbi:hypothetical protein CFOL_v3_18887 [Cephalotus follicularis]|uniref:Uncharacterized protein n=1 Tax=Cephalotus follicularis TaxID=3775 RepID=A0A1Q3C5P1_CEPFO|nr:hypothetical protein CFOL_v3_18887 [Cephalotus follicularis]
MDLKDLLWEAAKATTQEDFKKHMDQLKKLNLEAYGYLMGKEFRLWTRHAFRPFPKWDMLLNNLCECFNSAIMEARSKPIVTMLEMIKLYIMDRIVKKRQRLEDYGGPICPKIQAKIENARRGASYCIPH